jgi:hypothetical protein
MTAALAMSEADFQRWFIDTARLGGWKVCHFRPGLTQRGRWITAVQGDKGCPDLILAKDGRVLLVELKTDKGKATKEQVAWLAAAGGHGRLWRPENREAILLDLGVTKQPPIGKGPRRTGCRS